MKETEITVVGNVVAPPQRNRTPNGAYVTNLRVASTPRRFDKESQSWVDKPTLFLDVECWGDLSANVVSTLTKGDPVIVVGELYLDEWETDQGRRSRVKVKADTVGPDLTKGRAEFHRSRREQPAAAADAAPAGDDDGMASPATGYGHDEDARPEYTDPDRALYELDSGLDPEPAHV